MALVSIESLKRSMSRLVTLNGNHVVAPLFGKVGVVRPLWVGTHLAGSLLADSHQQIAALRRC